ncbi:cation:proton antiporter [Candidatus Nitronereus thalassa]|uniref:Cation:proton antiporter n=1 Tax=Candidatus Nitronereus thalassa TaxID=3020898 RepID=A0ABU3K932_9BACT|nr:cation:proton antiporter [Candidatus Nitronereus thalassa]MDT7042818.1 cation:proton antiporter [Candidatus Nitronereus thalassa]
MNLFLEILLVLLLTRIFSEGAERLGQPAGVGELLAGMALALAAGFLGTSLPFLKEITTSEALGQIAQVGIFFLMLLAGIESNLNELRQNYKGSVGVAIGGAAAPLTLGILLGWAILPESEFKCVQAMLIGISMAITSVPANIKVLTDFGLLHSRIGQTMVAAAIFDDVLGLFMLAVLTSMIQTGGPPDLTALAWLVVKILAFFAITVSLGVHVYPHISRGLKGLQSAALEFSALMAVGLGYGALAEALGMHWILGAFMAGLFFEPSRVGYKAYHEINLIAVAITRGFLGPFFFASIGLHLNFDVVVAFPWLILIVILLAFVGKLLGAGLPARLAGLNTREAMAVGVGMSSRGAVELIVLSIAAEAGLFLQGDGDHGLVTHLFSALVLMGVVTTLISPMILKRILPPALPKRVRNG